MEGDDVICVSVRFIEVKKKKTTTTIENSKLYKLLALTLGEEEGEFGASDFVLRQKKVMKR